MSAPAVKPKIPLRERKFAATKVGLMRAAMESLKQKPFSAITVKELCERVQVSEATFFNYFRKKEDVLKYFVRLWSIEVSWHARQAAGADGGLAVVEAVFERTGRDLAQHSRPMLEIIGHMALNTETAEECPHARHLCLAERLQAFPELEEVGDVPVCDLDDVMRAPLQRAAATGEIAADADIEAAVQALVCTFFGVPLWLKDKPEQIPQAYQRQLKLLWRGLGRS